MYLYSGNLRGNGRGGRLIVTSAQNVDSVKSNFSDIHTQTQNYNSYTRINDMLQTKAKFTARVNEETDRHILLDMKLDLRDAGSIHVTKSASLAPGTPIQVCLHL